MLPLNKTLSHLFHGIVLELIRDLHKTVQHVGPSHLAFFEASSSEETSSSAWRGVFPLPRLPSGFTRRSADRDRNKGLFHNTLVKHHNNVILTRKGLLAAGMLTVSYVCGVVRFSVRELHKLIPG